MSALRSHCALAAYVVVCLTAISWPGYAWIGDRVRPTILGLPFVFAWNVLWVLLSFVAVALYDRSLERVRRDP